MNRSRFYDPLVKVLAIVLCICLLASIGNAAEKANPATPGAAAEVRHSHDAGETVSQAQNTKPESAQALGEEELAELAERAEEPGERVVGGALSNEHLTYIVIALAAAVIVLIAT